MIRHPDLCDTAEPPDRDAVITLEPDEHGNQPTSMLVRIVDVDGRWLGVRYSLAGGLSLQRVLAERLAELYGVDPSERGGST